MATQSLEIIVEDFKGRMYKVHAIADCAENEGGYWCMVYRALGIGGNPYDYGEMEYEDDYSTDFCVHPEDCNCEDEMEVEQYIQSIFYDEDSFHDLIYAEDIHKKIQSEAKAKLKLKEAVDEIFEDRLYEFINEIMLEAEEKVNEDYDVSALQDQCDSSEMWYDEMRDEIKDYIATKIENSLNVV